MSRRQHIGFAAVAGGGGLLLLLGLAAARRRRIPRLRVIPEEIEQVNLTGTPANMSICRNVQEDWNNLSREYIRALQKWDILQWVKEHRDQLDPTKPLREYIDIRDPSILENLEQTNPEDIAHELRTMQQKLMNLRRFLQDGCFREPNNIPVLKIPLFQDTK